MKVLIDENIDVRFRRHFKKSGHNVLTVKGVGWNGTKNGELLKLLKKHNFDALIAVDKNLPYQQNNLDLPVKIIIIDIFQNTLPNLIPFVPLILTHLEPPIEKEVIVLSL